MGLCGFLICSLRQIYPLNPYNPMIFILYAVTDIFFKICNVLTYINIFVAQEKG